MHFINKRVITFLLLSILLINTGLLFWYIFYGYQELFHSDSAVKVLLAKEIFETGNYFPEAWNYANGDIMVFFGHTLIIPLLHFLPAGYTVHAISGSIMAILILSGLWFLSGITSASIHKRIIIVAIIAAGISGIVAENFYGQVSYGFTFFLLCFLIFFSWKYLTVENKYKLYYAIGLSIIVLLSFWGNPQRAFMTYIFPLLFSLIYYTYAYKLTKEKYDLNVLKLLVFIVISSILGFVLYKVTLQHTNMIIGLSHVRWVSYDTMILNLTLFIKQYLQIMNGLPLENSSIASISGIQSALRLVTSFMLVILIIHLLLSINLKKINGITFISVFAMISFFTVMFLQITTTIPLNPRYLVPSVILLIIVVLLKNYSFKNNVFLAVSSVIISLVLITQGYTVYFKTNKNLLFNKDVLMIGKPKKLVSFLIENNLKYGYATYWNAGRISVLSDEKVIINQIELRAGLPIPKRWLSSDSWYRSQIRKSKTFLLLSKKEAERFDLKTLDIYNIQVEDILKYDDFLIYIFDKDLTDSSLPHWSNNPKNKISFFASKYSNHNIGKYIEEEHFLVSHIGEEGALHFGPYINFKSGKYKITFDVSANFHEKGVVGLDVFSSSSKKIFAKKSLTSSSKSQVLHIDLKQEEKLEFRVFSTGREKVIFRGVSIIGE